MSLAPSPVAKVAAPSSPEDSPRRYRVFLSYSHADTKWARWLMRKLEGYRVSSRFHGRNAPIGQVGRRIAPVFRDRDELPSTSDLGETIRQALRQSATLVAICSPASARSRWVREEIAEFKRLGGEQRVFAFIVDGEPKTQGAADDCFSPALRYAIGPDGRLSDLPAEAVAADARPEGDGPKLAFVRLVAGLLGVGFDELRQRELQRRNRRLTLIAAGSTIGMAITLGLAGFALVSRNDAQRRQVQGEELLAFMLNDMNSRLQKADKLDAMEEAGARMTAYFQLLRPRDLTDNTLAQQSKALTQVGQIRISQLRYADADTAFTTAYSRAAALVERHPRNGDMLFERAQAEYWIGFVHYKRGNLIPAGEWLARYRDSGVALAGLDPKNLAWQREAVSGHHNLAVLELDRGNLAAARNGFLGERTVLEKMAEANPKEQQLQFSLANIDSFLGTTAERAGAFAEAVSRFGQTIARLEELLKANSQTARWRRRLADGLALQSGVLAIIGQRPAAVAPRKRAQEIFASLAAQDPANREFQVALLNTRLKEAILLRADGDGRGAARIMRETRPAVEKLAENESSDRAITALLGSCWRLEAQLQHDMGEPKAEEGAAQAMAIGKSLVEQNRVNDNSLGDYASACVVAGMIARRSGDTAAAQRHWQSAVDAVQMRGRETTHWRLLDPAVRALVLLGRTEESRALVERLRRLGYQPLEPWPEYTTP